MLQRQMPPFQQPMNMQQQRPYPTEMMRMPPMQMPQRRQGFLSKLLGRNRQAPYTAYPMNNQAPFPQGMRMTTNSPQSFSQYQQPGNIPMMNPSSNSPSRMSSEGASRMSSTAAAGKSARGIGTLFSNILANPSTMIGNVEKVVKVAQTVGPVVQQYSPFIKNFPNLTKMLSSLPKKEPETSTAAPVDEKHEAPIIKKEPAASNSQQKMEMKKEQTITEKRDRINRPKLYV